ncbi:MAG: FtsX-like permease family protein [Thermomicrobiaceae bacterium]
MDEQGQANNRGSFRRFFALIGAPLRRRMSADPVMATTFVIVILVTAAAVAAIPIILNRVGDRGLFETLDSALVIQRGITVQLESKIRLSGDPLLDDMTERGENFRTNLPDSLGSIIDDTHWTLDSPRHHQLLDGLQPATGGFQQFFQFRYQSGLDEEIELVDGREPEPTQAVNLSDISELPDGIEDETVPTYEVKIGRGTAEEMELEIGDLIAIQPDGQDFRNSGASRGYFESYFAIEIVGIFEPVAPESEFWFFDYRTYETDVVANPDQTIYYSMGIPAGEVVNEIQSLNDPGHWQYTWRYFVDPGAVAMSDTGRTTSDMQSLNQNLGPYLELDNHLQPNSAARLMNIRSMLPSLLTGAQQQYGLTSAVLSLVVAGLVTIGIALSGLLGALIASRRTPEIALMRSRGASGRQLSLSQITEGMVLALPAAVAGILIASLLTSGQPLIDSVIGALAVSLVGVLALWLLTRRIWNVDLGSLMGRRAEVPAGSSQRRIVAEFVIVAMAIAGIVLLRQRGVTTGAEQQGVDPYVAAVPVLAGLATGIVAVRLFPFLLRQLARLAGRRTDIIPFLGLRRIAEPSLGRHLPLMVMILALGMAVFAGAIWYSIETPEPIAIEELSMEEAEELASTRAGVNEAFQEGITQGFWLTIFMAGLYAILAVVCALALTADERRRDVGYLRTMGASRDQALGLTLIEQIPSALLAGVIGVGFGGLLTWLIAPGLDIASLYPPEEQVVIGINWVLAVGQAVGLIIVAIISATAFAYIARRSDLTDVLRAGE